MTRIEEIEETYHSGAQTCLERPAVQCGYGEREGGFSWNAVGCEFERGVAICQMPKVRAQKREYARRGWM